MKSAVLSGFFALACIFMLNGGTAHAEASKPTFIKDFRILSGQNGILAAVEPKVEARPVIETSSPKPITTVYEAGPNDSLTAIALKHDTTWVRLFYKNENITDPNVIVSGEKITIPLPDEQLIERPLPLPPVIVAAVQPKSNAAPANIPISRGGSVGNTYSPGYCTWYAKNMRPDLPNNLGNANTWVARAAAQGIATGSAPRVGAIGQQGMHVVYVQSVNGDGTVTISEMNYKGFGVISTRTVPAGTFQYIY